MMARVSNIQDGTMTLSFMTLLLITFSIKKFSIAALNLSDLQPK
jgi:hypothetical protein